MNCEDLELREGWRYEILKELKDTEEKKVWEVIRSEKKSRDKYTIGLKWVLKRKTD